MRTKSDSVWLVITDHSASEKRPRAVIFLRCPRAVKILAARDRKIHDAQAEWSVTSLLFNNRKFDMYKQFVLSKSCEMNRQGSNDHYGPVRNDHYGPVRNGHYCPLYLFHEFFTNFVEMSRELRTGNILNKFEIVE